MRQALLAVDGVVEAKVSYEEKCAEVEYRSEEVGPKRLIEAVNEIGFVAKLSENQESDTP